MTNIKEFYEFINSVWKFIKNTKTPDQSDQEAWDSISDKASEICREFTKRMADWMEMLREESLNGKRT